jgi:hypothetical protein
MNIQDKVTMKLFFAVRDTFRLRVFGEVIRDFPPNDVMNAVYYGVAAPGFSWMSVNETCTKQLNAPSKGVE